MYVGEVRGYLELGAENGFWKSEAGTQNSCTEYVCTRREEGG